MTDVHNEVTRSRNMTAIRGTNTRPELLIRKELFARGYHYRLNDKRLPGKPDLVLKKYRAVIFVHGCFWHRHNCPQFKWPSTRAEWWKEKLKGKLRLQPEDLFEQIEGWLLSDTSKSEICGSF